MTKPLLYNNDNTNYTIKIVSIIVIEVQRNDEKMKKQALKFHNYCTKKVDSNTEYLLAALYNNAEHTEPYKCYLQCIFDTLGLVDSDNQVNLEKLLNFTPTEIHEHILELHRACDTQPGKDSCDIVYTTSQCYYELKPAARGYLEYMMH
ncbi:odorant-binding protein 69a isoform 2-T2 [Glossina fuscipes fuscipes]